MRILQSMAVPLVVVLALGTAVGIVLTSEWSGKRTEAVIARAAAPPSPVNLQPLTTAQELARLASLPEEQPLSREALRLADRDADLAFTAALREAVANPIPLDGPILDSLMRMQDAEKLLENDQKRVAQLTVGAAAAFGKNKEDLEQELQVARAELELDQNEMEDAKEELVRAGGDPRARIQRMVEEHEAARHAGSATAATSVAPSPPSRGLLGRLGEWTRLRDKLGRLLAAGHDSVSLASSLAQQRQGLEKQIEAEKAKTPELAQRVEGTPEPAGSSRDRERSAALLASAKRLSAIQKQMAALDKRTESQRQLAGVYRRWDVLVTAQERASMHDLLLRVLWLLLTVLAMLACGRWLDRFWTRLSPDQRRLLTLRTVARIAIEAVGACVILLLLFGPPAQLATVVGLAGAGLTVALKDFILAFFGWFVLMAKNGIRVGDWVEIKGVGGEVAEIGLFHTVLLEAGNWNETGHPTGRRVSFMNSFAIEGHYFNFSTAGQWLWDELRVNLAADDPGPIVEAIQKRVAEETAEDTLLAEQEWQRVARTRGMSAFSAEPAINVRPGPAGVEIVVRYITRASQRHQVRSKLYRTMVDLLRQRNVPPPVEASPVKAPAA